MTTAVATTRQATLAEMRQTADSPQNLPAISVGLTNLQGFELAQRAAKLLSNSTLVPAAYRARIEKKDRGGGVAVEDNPNALANCVVALNMAQRMGADPLMVMQNLYIVEGRPSWSSQWIIAAINGCGRFSPLRFDIQNHGRKDVEYAETYWENRQKQTRTIKVNIDDKVCVAWAIEKETGARIESPPVSIEMAVKEGWYTKNGSKWKTMDEVMLRYRTASFFGKLYAPELLMGIQSAEEVQDYVTAERGEDGTYRVTTADIKQDLAAKVQSSEADAKVPETADARDETTGPAGGEGNSDDAPEPYTFTDNHGEVHECGGAEDFAGRFTAALNAADSRTMVDGLWETNSPFLQWVREDGFSNLSMQVAETYDAALHRVAKPAQQDQPKPANKRQRANLFNGEE